jgi:hypothetical protein
MPSGAAADLLEVVEKNAETPAKEQADAPPAAKAPGLSRPPTSRKMLQEERQKDLKKAQVRNYAADADSDGLADGFFDDSKANRAQAQRRFFQKLDATKEWAENNYYHLPIEQQLADLVPASAFWADYAAHDGKTPFLSTHFAEATGNFTEMMLALAVLDLPFEAGKHTEALDGLSYNLTAASPLVMFHREIREAARAEQPGAVLVAQRFFRADDRYRNEGNGAELNLDLAVLSNETIVIDLEARTIWSTYRGQMPGALARTSDLTGFCLQPGSTYVSVLATTTGSPTIVCVALWRDTFASCDG